MVEWESAKCVEREVCVDSKSVGETVQLLNLKSIRTFSDYVTELKCGGLDIDAVFEFVNDNEDRVNAVFEAAMESQIDASGEEPPVKRRKLCGEED